MILGIDEVGRGPWAGPLVVGAVVLGEAQIDGLTDSKKLTKARREAIAGQIIESAAGVGLGWVEVAEIDNLGLTGSLELATRRAVEQINTPYHEIIIDGTINFLKKTNKGRFVTTIKKADLLIPSVSAASIVAKVARDDYMAEIGNLYPDYGFERHVGYGTAAHRLAIEHYGVTPEHRLSYAPLSKYRDTIPKPGKAQSVGSASSTRRIGDASESEAARELARRGHEIVERNWKTKYCEIDIVSRLDGVYYFSEVKHRSSSSSGDGLDVITPRKLRQMHFAARLYGHLHNLSNVDMRLLAVATTGSSITLESIIELS